MIGAPIVLARAVRARYGVSWKALGVGAGAYVLSQVGHIPFNLLVAPHLPSAGGPYDVLVAALFYGLSAGCFEELARFVAMRSVLEGERTGPHALAFGIGHGGIESILFGLLVAIGLVNIAILERVGIEHVGLDQASMSLAREQLVQYHDVGVLPHVLAALERICAIALHVAASTLVMRAIVEKRVRWLLVAIAYHAISDGMILPIGLRFGGEVLELVLFATLPLSLLTAAVTVRALPRLARPAPESRPDASGAPIEVVRAEKTYGDVRALRGVSFTLREGERACLLGPNGAGKTTTIRMITGAIAPSRGFVFVLGAASDDADFLEKKRKVGIVPQQPGMYEHLTVRQYLSLVRELYERGDTALVAAQRLGLEGVLDRATSALSGGMQRRLALAAALLPHPDVLVLDEPSAGLDPVASRQMIEAVKAASANRTTLLCTHNLSEAEELCDSVIILREGEVVVHATIESLRSQVSGRVALRAHGGEAALVAAIEALGHTPQIDEGEVRVVVAEPDRAAPAILRALLERGVDVYECRIVKPSLEDLFFRVVEGGGLTPSVPPKPAAAHAEEKGATS